LNLTPLLDAPLPVKIHVATVMPAFFIGTWQMFVSHKGSRVHRRVGYVYLALMTATAITALFVHQINPNGLFGLSWIHIFVLITLGCVAGAIYGALTHNLPRHKGSMIGLYVGGLLIAGGLAFAPGRIMHEVLFH